MVIGSAALEGRRYTVGAIALHWIIAALLLGQIGLGWYMGDLPDHSPAQRNFEGVHISLGLTILILTVARLTLAVVHRPPRLPMSIAKWERRMASFVQSMFYVMLLALPLSGWLMESIGPRPISFWGLTWPHMPGLSTLLQGHDKGQIKDAVEEAHGSPLVWATIALTGLHVLGAVKHQFDGSPILWRMAPFLRRP
ncbi:MAG: cytochrome b [Caulobacteraceae bacterium]